MPETITGYRDLEVQPNVWCGLSLIRGGPAFGLVGSYEQVAQRLDKLINLGVDAFILAGNPHLEEAYRIGVAIGSAYGGVESSDYGYRQLYGENAQRLHPLTIPRLMHNAAREVEPSPHAAAELLDGLLGAIE